MPKLALLGAAGLLIAGCGGPAATPTPQAGLTTGDLPRTGGCGDAVVFAGSANDDLLVVITWPDAATRAKAEGSFDQTVSLPSGEVLVRLQIGRHLSEGQCTDVIMPDRPTILGQAQALSGTLRLHIEPDPGDPIFPTGRATVALAEVVFEFGSGDNAERRRIDELDLRDINVGWLPG